MVNDISPADLARGTGYKVPALIRIAAYAAGALTEALFGAFGDRDRGHVRSLHSRVPRWGHARSSSTPSAHRSGCSRARLAFHHSENRCGPTSSSGHLPQFGG